MSNLTETIRKAINGQHIPRRQLVGAVLEGGLVSVGAAVALKTREVEAGVDKKLFEISGVPERVAKSKMEKTANEAAPAAGDVIHTNEILLGSEHWIADPGNRTYSTLGVSIDSAGKKKWSEAQAQIDLEQEQAGSCWQTSEYRETFTHEDYPFLTPEGGFVMITGAGLDMNFPEGQSLAEIHLGARENHTWIVIVRGLPRDYETPLDRNVMINTFNMVKPGAVNGTKLPPGQFVSGEYFKDNAATAHGKLETAINCGTDGCAGVSALFYDVRLGAYTWINQATPDAPWTLVQTNLV